MMKFILKPSLEHMALVKIVISLFNQNDVRALISKSSYANLYPIEWWEIEQRVIRKVPQLSIPQLLKEKMFGVITPIGMQIFEWMQYYRKYDIVMEFDCINHDFPAPLPADFCWTPQGTVDRKRTAKVMVRDENLNLSRRYILACDNFLEDDIIQFWNRLPENLKDYDWHNSPVISFWSNNMKIGGVGHISYKNAFYSSVGDSNKVAAKYLLQKLIPQEREECLKNLAKHTKNADVLCFLLPELEEEEQNEVLKNNPHRVLQCFLQWPWQSFFIAAANYVWDFLSKNNYDEILRDIIVKVREGYKDYNYQKLFREFWKKSPSALKDTFIEEIDKSWLLQCLFSAKDKENIRLILKDATLTAKEKLIFSDTGNVYCKYFICINEWDFLEFFIRECLPSKKAMLKFKEEFEKCMYFEECFAAEKQKWNELFRFSDDSICE